ncbi:MAG: uroporphyrinogen-III synthase [Vagococcus sp.]|uniref:uroporphyrinogen-III synthase n=1 Tax=Vagococcus sp. TaxID=1933889 RepID=UPI002FC93E67
MLRTILYTREHSCPEVIKRKFLENKLEIKEIPLIKTIALKHDCPKEKIDWVFFTSVNTVKYLDKTFDLTKYQIASIGNKTTECLNKNGVTVDFQPTHAVAECFADEWLAKQTKSQRVFLPNSALARPVLNKKLTASNHEVMEEHVYTTIFEETAKNELKLVLQENSIKDVMLSSPSIWQHFKEVADEMFVDLSNWRLYSIGPITSRAVEASGETVFKEAKIYDMSHLYEEILKEIK